VKSSWVSRQFEDNTVIRWSVTRLVSSPARTNSPYNET